VADKEAHKIMMVGGAGDMSRVSIQKLLNLSEACQITIADINRDKAERVARLYQTPRVTACAVDVHDPGMIRKVVKDSDLVVNATGPLYRTGRPVLQACIDERVNYMDYGDTFEASEDMLQLQEEAKNAGITAMICCGLIPGLMSVIVRAFALRMDQAESIDLAWMTGATPEKEDVERGGEALVEHMLFECMGTCKTFKEGAWLDIPAFRQMERVDFPAPLGAQVMYQIGHAEVSTFPRFLPGLRNVRVFGAIRPAYHMGTCQGIARQIEKGSITMKEAIEFFGALDTGKKPTHSKPYLGFLRGIGDQVFRGDLSILDLIKEMKQARKGEIVKEGSLLVRVEGLKDNERTAFEFFTVEKGDISAFSFHAKGKSSGFKMESYSSEDSEPGMGGMDEVTGTPLSAFAYMVLTGMIQEKGVLAPEACVDPMEYFRIFGSIEGFGREITSYMIPILEQLDAT